MKLYKKILITLLIVFIAIQFIQPAHNTSGQVLPADITKTVRVPDSVLNIFKSACYDCHTNNTRYPWYVYIEPMGWIMARHIRNGKENLNFSDFGSYSQRKQANKLRAIETSIKEGSMPLSSYTIMHTDARLSLGDKKVIAEWVSSAKDSLSKNK
ncbi:MAG: heme-binding domain-containing protein [Ferruginibacter sp.]|nr:heme-binding domain-containing protein [Ferruginibacter sp.]